MRKAIIIIAAILIGVILAAVPQQAHAATNCSIPIVSDVNEWDHGCYLATVEVAGKPIKLQVYHGRYRIPADRIGKHTWLVKIKKNCKYTIKTKAKHGGWKVVEFKLRRY